MSTYLIGHLRIPAGVPNEQGLSYVEQVEATLAPFGGAYLAQGSPDVKEGSWDGFVVLMEFPNRTAAEGWYASEAYQQILPLRVGSSIADTVLVDHLPEGFNVAARQLPHPAVHDEPAPAHQQHPLARIIQDHCHRAAPHPEDVLREAHLVRKLDIGQAHTDVRGPGWVKSFGGNGFHVAEVEEGDISRIAELVEQHVSLPLGIVDAAVITIAERLNLSAVATVDRKHFSVVRPRHVSAFRLPPEAL
jgi:uncharacterized protein (DUF1330 family)